MRSYSERLRIWETNYGRDAGWTVERRGEVIAVLTDPRFEEMFWDSYRMEVVAANPELRQRLQTTEFWAMAESEDLVWRSLEFGEVTEHAFPSLTPFPEPGRLTMRGLYLPSDLPRLWDRLALWWRRRLRRGTAPVSAPEMARE